MLKIVTVERMRMIEAAADAAGHSYDTMMQNAGRAIAQRVQAILAGYEDAHITILVGKGNNGGDGLVAARLLAQESEFIVRCYLLEKRDTDPLLIAARDAGATSANAEDDHDQRVLRQMIGSAHVILDALFGIGVRLPLRGEAVNILRTTSNMLRQVRALGAENEIFAPATPRRNPHSRFPYVLAVDCPSGLDCDTGEIDDHAINADETITFIAAKTGLLTFPGASAVGQLTAATIGVPDDLAELSAETAVLVDADYVRQLLPARPINSHKGTYGKALIIGGSSNYRGAVGLSALAAYRIGAGLVTVSALDEVIDTLAGHVLEATWLPYSDQISTTLHDYDSLLLGPGWSRTTTARDQLTQVLNNTSDSLPATVIDADGLNILAETDHWWERLPPTDHHYPPPRRDGSINGKSLLGEVQASRWSLASRKSELSGMSLSCSKGAHTLDRPAPTGQIVALPYKTDALAKAGTGDVLAGILAGIIGSGTRVTMMLRLLAATCTDWLGSWRQKALGTTRSVLASDCHRGATRSASPRY